MLIETKAMSVRLDGKTILDPVDFAIERGEIVTIVGPNGAGKTTFLRSLIGALQPAAGSVNKKAGLRIGYVPQKLQLNEGMPLTARRFLDLPVRSDPADLARMAEFTSITHLLQVQMSRLSGGELQRVLLAGALLCKPDLLILDEATRGLDHLASIAFYRQIEQARQQLGCAVLMVSHDLHVVMAASDRVICLNGHICCQGTPEQVVQAQEYQALFGTDSSGIMALYRHEHDHRHDHHHHETA